MQPINYSKTVLFDQVTTAPVLFSHRQSCSETQNLNLFSLIKFWFVYRWTFHSVKSKWFAQSEICRKRVLWSRASSGENRSSLNHVTKLRLPSLAIEFQDVPSGYLSGSKVGDRSVRKFRISNSESKLKSQYAHTKRLACVLRLTFRLAFLNSLSWFFHFRISLSLSLFNRKARF